jgi:hypothetical protein
MLVRTGKGQRTVEAGEGIEGVAVFQDLSGLADELTR